MAEYYPLISRAVAGLRTGTPEARQAIYSRAQQALVGQLRAMQPPVPEEAIHREITALDDAIARVEADLLGPAPTPVGTTPPLLAAASRPVPPAPPIVPRVPAATRTSDMSPSEAPVLGGVQRPNPPRIRPTATRPTMPLVRPSPSRPPAPPPDQGTAVPPPASKPDEPAPASDAADAPVIEPSADGPAPATAPFPVAATLQIEQTEGSAQGRGPGSTRADDDTTPERVRDDVARPAAPRPVEERRPNVRVWIVAVAALAAVVAIAFTAWRLRDNPRELARVPAVTKSAEPDIGKIAERADGTTVDVGQADSNPSGPPVTNATSAPASDAPSTTVVPDPVGSPPAATGQAVPIAYKAAILVDAPEEPQKVKTYVGTVVWRTETVSQGQDQPIGTEVRADIEIPDAKLQMVMQFRRNTEAQFPASHTMELKFTVAADSPLAGIKQINVPQMRRDDMPTGDPLAGVPVTITDNYFLIGLTRGDPESRNLDLVQSRGWFDIPMLLANGKASKITFEKGASGAKIFDDVLQVWKSTQN